MRDDSLDFLEASQDFFTAGTFNGETPCKGRSFGGVNPIKNTDK